MIPATKPIVRPSKESVTYDSWVPVSLSGGRPDAGRFSISVRLAPCRVLADGATELDPDGGVIEMSIPDINAPASDEYPKAVRDACQQAAGAIIAAAMAVGTARGVL